jgi:hypothetical protein
MSLQLLTSFSGIEMRVLITNTALAVGSRLVLPDMDLLPFPVCILSWFSVNVRNELLS